MTRAGKPTVGEELVALRATIQFGLQEMRTELGLLTKQLTRLNGSVADVVTWKIDHSTEHATVQKVAAAKRSVWRSQWQVLLAGLGAGAGTMAIIGGVLALLGRF